jgi:hypothetical protein
MDESPRLLSQRPSGYWRGVVRASAGVVYSVTLVFPWLLAVSSTLTLLSWMCAGALWIALAVDYFHRLLGAPLRRAFVLHAVATPLLLTAPLLMLLHVPASLVVVLLIVAFVIEVRHLEFGHQFAMALTAVVGIGIISAIAMAIFERNAAGSQLRTVGDTFTWALSTVFDVRGDNAQPVTENGRILGVVVVLCGVLFTWAMFSQMTAWILGAKHKTLDENSVDRIVRSALADSHSRPADQRPPGVETGNPKALPPQASSP